METNAKQPNTKKKPFWKRTWFIIVAALVLIFILYKIFHHAKSTQTFVTVKQGSITETVTVTGNSTPTNSVSLGFQNNGTVASVNYNIGAYVPAGAVIATLDTSNLEAQLQQAQANVDVQQANLAGLKAGAQPEDIASSQAALEKAQQDLANMYASIPDASNSAYSSANDAVRTQLNSFFTQAETGTPQLTFQTSSPQSASNATTLRASASAALNAWQTELSGLGGASNTTLASTVGDEVADLNTILNLLNAVSTALNSSVGLSSTQVATYKASVTTAITEVNTALKSLNTITQNISSQNLTVAQAQAQLALLQAGSTASQIAAQQAEVEQAQASVASAQANLSNAEIVAPISGVITEQDAKVGQVAGPGTPLVSIISNGQFEVDADVPETDIGKVSIGNPVSMTFDAFPNQTFAGKVFYINQGETITGGVVDYLIKVSFNTPSPQMKSGLTANLDISTKTDANALILPQYAILVNDSGSFVETLAADKKTVVTTPVTLGIQDENGNVEVLTGVTAGEQVLNIGLKTTQ